MGDNNLALAITLPLIAWLALYVWIAASLSAVFRKAGEPGWQAWVPVLNVIVLLRLGRLSAWWALLLVVPVIGTAILAVIVWIACHRINAEFGVGAGMTVLAILLFPVWSSILGWGSARWLGHDRRAPGPVRGDAGRLDGRIGSPAFAGLPAAGQTGTVQAAPPVPSIAPVSPFGAGGVPLDNIPPRPTSFPAAPPAGWPAATAATPAPAAVPAPAIPAIPASPEPAIVTRVPSAASGADDPGLADDEGPVRRRTGPVIVSEVPISPDGTPPPGSAGHDSSRIPFTGTVPLHADHSPRDVPAGPRRAVMPDSVEDDGHLLETRDEPPAHSVPAIHAPYPGRDPWAPPDGEPPVRTPRYSPGPAEVGFSETSAEVSAVAAAPSVGTPMAARSSVSSLRDEPELPEAENAFDETIIAARRRTPWMLTPPLGAPIPVTSDVLIVGRRPSSDPSFAHAQLVPIADETRTMSKTHARLEHHDDGWTIVDLDSTNGVVLVRPDGTEVELMSGRPEPVTDSFLLGDAELRLTRSPGAE